MLGSNQILQNFIKNVKIIFERNDNALVKESHQAGVTSLFLGNWADSTPKHVFLVSLHSDACHLSSWDYLVIIGLLCPELHQGQTIHVIHPQW